MPHAAATTATDNEFECRSTRHMQKSIGECFIRHRLHPIGMVNVWDTFFHKDNKVRMELNWNGILIGVVCRGGTIIQRKLKTDCRNSHRTVVGCHSLTAPHRTVGQLLIFRRPEQQIDSIEWNFGHVTITSKNSFSPLL